MPRPVTPGTAPDPAVAQLLRLLDEAYERRSWHGTNLRGSIRGLTPAAALWRGRSDGKAIAQIVVHCAYWKYAVRRRLRHEPRGSFPLKGSNWFALPADFSAGAWRECLQLLEREHRALRAAIADLTAVELGRADGSSRTSSGALARGVAAHDLYHAGQIQLIKGLHRRG